MSKRRKKPTKLDRDSEQRRRGHGLSARQQRLFNLDNLTKVIAGRLVFVRRNILDAKGRYLLRDTNPVIFDETKKRGH